MAALMVLVQTGCRTVAPQQALTADELARAMPLDGRALDRIARDSRALQREFVALRDSGGWQERGYFSPEESDRVELLMLRFHTAHHQLAEISDRYEGVGSRDARELRSRAGILAKQQARGLVETFRGDRVAVKKLNQAFPRSEIPRRTYDKMEASLQTKVVQELDALEQEIEGEFDQSSYTLQADLFFGVSRLKAPQSYVVKFSEAQKREIEGRLQPGDLVLTYTGGYASNIFIPGSFKHGITYVGTPAERNALGLSPQRIVAAGAAPQERDLAERLQETSTAAGRQANLIEAVGEGVKFSNLEHIMDTHIWRMLVIRPRLDQRDRALQLGRTFSYLGQEYDFRFDFADSSRQVCTEVIYRSLNGVNGIDLPLRRRGGHVTLSADDLITYWLEERPEAFEFVLYAEEAPRRPGHRAHVLDGESGMRRLEELMQKGR